MIRRIKMERIVGYRLVPFLMALLVAIGVACGGTSSEATPTSGSLPTPSPDSTMSAEPTLEPTRTPVAEPNIMPTAASDSPGTEPTSESAATPTPTLAPILTPTVAPTSATPDQIKVGAGIGDRAPDFTVRTVDGQIISLAGLLAEKKPVLLYFFASW